MANTVRAYAALATEANVCSSLACGNVDLTDNVR